MTAPYGVGSRPKPRNLGKARDSRGRVDQTGDVFLFNARAKVGATAGWAIPTTTDTPIMATMAAGGTASTLVVNLDGLKVGAVLKNVHLVGQGESAGNTATITLDLRRLRAVAADITDASVDAFDAATSITADTVLSEANAVTPTLDHTVEAGYSYYALITATTAASTDWALMGVGVRMVLEPAAY